MPPIQMLQALCLVGFLSGPLQVWCLQEKPLDMALQSVDDQYLNCSPMKAPNLQKAGYLPVPLKYKAIWENARRPPAKPGQTVKYFKSIYPKSIYDTAIVAYTMDSTLYRDFNQATRLSGASQLAYNHFAFKDFHFLLTQAVKSRKVPGRCYQVFRGIKDIWFSVRLNQLVRFGQFASASFDKRVAQNFGGATLFSIKTCYGVPINDLSFYSRESEVLIPPYEQFNVTSHEKNRNGVFIELASRGVYSHINCKALKVNRGVTTHFQRLGP